MLRNLLNDESGFLISAELVLIFTLVFCAVAVGMGVIKDSLAQELGDVAEAIGALDQTYNYRGIQAPSTAGGGTSSHARCSGSGFNDENDDCDCLAVQVDVAEAGKNDPSTLDVAEGT
jgi:hypothetical protein